MTNITIRPLIHDDLALGYRLSTSAGWNQLPADWERVYELESSASFVASLDGRDVGTVTAVVFDSIAWIGLMLVEPWARGQGVGRALMERVLNVLDARHVRSVRLDATPLGQPLYEKLGFRSDYQLHRYAGLPRAVFPSTTDDDVRIALATAADLSRIAALDAQVTATRRARFLERLFQERRLGARIAVRGDTLAGFALERAGRLGTLVGPCIGDSATGATLLAAALTSLADTNVLIDIPDDHAQARAVATQFGLTPMRPLARMTRGPHVPEDVARLWASSGPEKG